MNVSSNIDRCVQVVREKFETHKEGMEILSLDEDGLTRVVPQGSAVQESSVVLQLRKLMDDVGGQEDKLTSTHFLDSNVV